MDRLFSLPPKGGREKSHNIRPDLSGRTPRMRSLLRTEIRPGGAWTTGSAPLISEYIELRSNSQGFGLPNQLWGPDGVNQLR